MVGSKRPDSKPGTARACPRCAVACIGVLLGAYVYLEDTRRISVVFSRTLSASDPPVQGYALSLSQKRELDELYLDWLSWIKAQTGAEDKEEDRGLGRYFEFIWELE